MSEIPIQPRRADALILVDVQNDFLPGGSLGVPRGDEVVPVLNRAIAEFRRLGLPVVATRDWHTPDHCSFAARGGPWPPHCVAGSAGAHFATRLDLPCEAHIVSKGTQRDKDAYSGFEGTGLDEWLRGAGVSRLFVGGLATDYCVLNTVRDARRLGYDAIVLADAVRAVDVQPGDGERALEEMRRLGARVIEFAAAGA
ncbi:MAG TPA: nicotinamidase [Candidatus Desulfobacillus sp.]|nr:nicotinamidase [Candidatus Desulfobacillus sp.]